MIASLSGQLKAVADQQIVVEVHGVGYRVHVTRTLLEQIPGIGQFVELHTRMYVRENDLSLYGFRTVRERDLFDLLLEVSGIGPRTALACLSAFAPETLHSLIAQGDAAALTRVPGVGRKTAQRLVLDLRERLGGAEEILATPSLSEADADVINALTALGYSLSEARSALGAIPEDVKALDERILAALRVLGS